MKKALLLTLLFALFTTLGFSQTDKFWSSHINSGTITTDKAVARLSFPKEFKLFDLNISPLRQELFSVTDNKSQHSTIISLPNAQGNFEQFEVFEASNFEPDLQAKFPEIRAFSGKGITDKYATLKLSISPQGIQTMIFRTERQNEFMEPYSQDHTVYAVFKSQRDKGPLQWTCSTPEQNLAESLNAKVAGSGFTNSNAGELKTMRLAQSCNAEYSNFFGATTANMNYALVYAAFNATLTRCNGCYEKDLALHLNLISNTFEDQLIFFNPATDPYTTLGAWNGQLQNLLNTVVGDANYDIGHMFGGSGGGGNAGCIGCVCVAGQKGSGITSPADAIPMGDNFDIDYVAHEVGHQLGGNHTFSMSIESGGINNVEVGSGITIMGYAGITPQDVAPHSIDIFHERSIQQIQLNLGIKTCPITTNIAANNATPVVAPMSNYTIPITTPFALTGSATDANAGDVLTYCWEQNDAANSTVTGVNSVASPGKLVGPNWLSYPATTSPTRYFPKLSTVQAGLFVTPPLPGGDPGANVEAVSSVSRALNFRLTVRDNCPYSSTAPVKVGQTAFTDMTVTVTNTAGPFQVTSPNTNVSWAGGSSQTITWDVNNTTAAPVSCANVKISMSTDGGNTFPTVISASTPNDGSELVTIPAGATTTARIKVEAVGNIFYDMSNTNFTVTASNPTFDFVPSAGTSVPCGSASAAITLQTTSILGFVTPINLVATGNPGGTNVTYSVNPVAPGSSTVVTLNNMNVLIPGTYNVTITGTAGAEIKTIILAYVVSPGSGPAISAQPSPQTLCASGTASFSITSAGATSFQWQESTTGAGGPWNNITNGGVYGGANSATLTLTGVTAVMNTYQYRAVAIVQCGSTNSSAALLTVQTPPSFTAQPANSTVCEGVGSATFSVTAIGTGLGYQWQVSVVGGCGGPWVNIANAAPYSGVTTATLTINPTTPAMNGFAYRCVVTGTCSPAATSGCAVLTVNTAVAITTQPISSTICAGANTSFTTAASGTGPSYQWQESTNGGANWNNIANGGIYSGATTVTLTLTGVTAAMNTYQYRAVVNGTAPCGSANSSAAVLTVNTAPSISTQPVAATTLCVGGGTTYTIAANGTAVTYKWQLSTTGAGGPWTDIANGGVYSGATTASLTLTGVTAAMNSYQYRSIATGTCNPAATSNATVLTVNTPINVTTQPLTNSICATGSTSFVVAVTGTSPTYQWQVSTTGAGGPWNNIANGGVYGGATTTTLTLTNITAAMNGYQYRSIVTGAAPCGAATSNAAVLNVTPLPVISASPLTSLVAGQTTTLTVNVSPAPGLSFSWYLNGSVVSSSTGNTLIVTVNELGSYRVVVSSATGSCTSDLITIKDTASSKLFIYPSPNNGQFTVAYYNAGGTTPTVQGITIYDRHGARVFNNTYPVSLPYQLHKIDMRRNAAGVYYVVIRDANGKKIKTGEVVIR